MADSSYRDMLFDQLIFQQMYPRGTSEWIVDETTGKKKETAIDPVYQTKNPLRRAGMQASLREDEMLRGRLGSRRELREGERIPEGAYTSVRDPFTWLAARQAQGGAPARRFGAVDIWSTPRERQDEIGRNRNWGQHQLSLWGM